MSLNAAIRTIINDQTITPTFDVDGTLSQTRLNALTDAAGLVRVNFGLSETANGRAVVLPDKSEPQVMDAGTAQVKVQYRKWRVQLGPKAQAMDVLIALVRATIYTDNPSAYTRSNPNHITAECGLAMRSFGLIGDDGATSGDLSKKDRKITFHLNAKGEELYQIIRRFAPAWYIEPKAKAPAAKKPSEFRKCSCGNVTFKPELIRRDAICPSCGKSLHDQCAHQAPVSPANPAVSDYSKAGELAIEAAVLQ